MTPERRAEVLWDLFREIQAEHEQVAGQRLDMVKEQAQAVYDAIQAAKAPKPSESSMVQRIEALESFIRRAIPIFQIEVKWGGCAKCDPGNEGGEIFGEMLAEAKTLLDGPPDPERGRETRAELARP